MSLKSITSLTKNPSYVKWAIGCWSFFIAENFILSENRSTIISHVGDDNYHYVYGTCSTIAVSSIAYTYFRKLPLEPLRAVVPNSSFVLGVALQCFGWCVASQVVPKFQMPFSREITHDDNTQVLPQSPNVPEQTTSKWKVRCPFDFTHDNSSTSKDNDEHEHEPRGIDRISRHAGLWSMAFISAGHGILLPSIPKTIFFTMPMFVALIGGAHMDSRFKRGMGGSFNKIYEDQTSNIPMLAMAMGKQGSDAMLKLYDEGKGLNALFGVCVAVGISMRTRRKSALLSFQH